MLHQTPRSLDEFAEVLPLVARARRAVAIDTPGYGCSDAVAGQPSIADYAAGVVGVLDALSIPAAVFVGHHTGAVIACELAAGHPARTRSVVLSGPVFLDADTRDRMRPYFVQWQVRPDGAHFAEKWQRFSHWTGDPALVQRLMVDLFRAGLRSEQGHFAVLDYPMAERLPLVRCDALLVFGARDPFAFREKASAFHRYFKTCREVTLDAGVFLPNEAPEALAAAVLGFA
jgi:pimeloyl-ACP methyl ester carboxylesterase